MVTCINPVFHPCIAAQRATNELVVYAREVGQVVTIAYPQTSHGYRVTPEGFFYWLERCGLTFECFCGMVSSQPTPARFIHEFISGDVVVRCNDVNNHCGFYWRGGILDLPALIATFHDTFGQQPYSLTEVAPIFTGYCGIHESIFPGYPQLRGGISHSAICTPTPHTPRKAIHQHRQQPYTKTSSKLLLAHQSATKAASCEITGPSHSNKPQLSVHERDVLARLSMGTGRRCMGGLVLRMFGLECYLIFEPIKAPSWNRAPDTPVLASEWSTK
ncbi:uncharacterized protein F5147DRAFT_659503 [Suillus discolor]|uniref:Uncharacterized protein n=1 Tax=Suillus discolor TaxID=1912936 RepID=A0A9P7ESC3_9AGAM|nr:uncharacterized protein F5147DRAFT_659503 [Suillus discolor]KAG2085473.1 hypothetical protein F5147DRAFT_659503 [Suillus discolor]